MNCNTDTVSISDMLAEVDSIITEADSALNDMEILRDLAIAEGYDLDAQVFRVACARLAAVRKGAERERADVLTLHPAKRAGHVVTESRRVN